MKMLLVRRRRDDAARAAEEQLPEHRHRAGPGRPTASG